jgi:hypothetical protein
VPPVWYHARLRTVSSAAGAALDLNGVTLPGAPVLVAGSNAHIAWGFTNSYGSWLGVTQVPCGTVALSVVREEIRVHGQAAVVLEVKSGPAGVLLRADEAQHSCWFGSWLAQQAAATNLGLLALERATSVAEALALAPGVGIPHQNVVIGDAQGHIGWTIYGRIPEDTGATRARGGAPWTTTADHPRIVDPPLGRIWTANARVAADDHQLQLIGGDVATLGAEYDLGARAGQIRDDLLALQGKVTPADMLRIQLDDRAVFLARWRTLLLGVLDTEALRDHPRRAQVRQLIASWNARASVDSVGYRLVRAYHDRTQQAVWDMLLAGLHLPVQVRCGSWSPRSRCICWRRLIPAGRSFCVRRSTPRSPSSARAAPSSRTVPGAHTTWCASVIRCRAPCRGSPHSSTCRPWNCRGTMTCRACRTARSVPPSASRSPPVTSSRVTSTCRAGRAGIRCRRITARGSGSGRWVRRCRFCRDRLSTRSL